MCIEITFEAGEKCSFLGLIRSKDRAQESHFSKNSKSSDDILWITFREMWLFMAFRKIRNVVRSLFYKIPLMGHEGCPRREELSQGSS